MPLKTVKKDAADKLTLEWILHVKKYKLALDKARCVGCQICSLACPKEAIKLQKQPKKTGEKTRKAKVDVDLTKCNFCGICDITCPYGAVKVASTGKQVLKVLEKESFPEMIRDIQIDESKVSTRSLRAKDPCPLNL